MTIRFWLPLAGALVGAAALAQEISVQQFEVRLPAPDMAAGTTHTRTMKYVASEMGMPGKVVKGAPYSAEAVTETTQTLADGNRIHHQNSSKMWRDGEGRTRRQLSFAALGPLSGEDLPELTTIDDPVANMHYTLNAKDRTVHKAPMPAPGDRMHVAPFHMETAAAAGAVGTAGALSGDVAYSVQRRTIGGANNTKTEPLGRRNIEGVDADGTRVTITIPAGAEGNERPMEMVDERWFSPELQTLVMSRHTDPRMGETVFRLTNISRSEPAPSLFEVPADYKVEESGSTRIMIRK